MLGKLDGVMLGEVLLLKNLLFIHENEDRLSQTVSHVERLHCEADDLRVNVFCSSFSDG